MDAIKATFDLTLYPPQAVIRAVHRFTGSHSVDIERTGDMAHVTLVPRGDGAPDVSKDLVDAVVDEALREEVHVRTGAIHDVLVRAAFAPLAPLP